jgi:uncharacterized membrane protein
MRLTKFPFFGLVSVLTSGVLAVMGCTSAPMITSVHSTHDLGKLGGTHSFTIGVNQRDRVVSDVFTVSNAVPDATLSRISASASIDLGRPGNTYSYARDIDNNLWWADPNRALAGVIHSI